MKTYMPALTIAATVALSLMNCAPRQAQMMDFTFSTDSIHWTDSVVVDSAVSRVDIYVATPKESSMVYAAATQWIAGKLGAQTDLESMTMQAIVDKVGTARIDRIKSNLAEVKGEGFDPIDYAYTWQISPIYFTNHYVTYTDSAYRYDGGSHGVTKFDAATFTLADGKRWGYDMFKENKLDDLRRMVVDAIAKQYFGQSDADSLNGIVFDPVDKINLPGCAPYLVAGGVAFTYQEYEIAPYSAGMPTCVLSLFDVHNLLNEDFAEYVEQ